MKNTTIKKISVSDIVLSSLFVVFGLIVLFVYLYMPFPERWNPNEFDEYMFKLNEHITFYCLVVFGTFTVATYISSLILRQILSIWWYKYQINEINDVNKNRKIFKIIGLVLIAFINIFIPFIISIYYLVKLKNDNNQNKQIKHKKLYITYKASICLFPIICVGIITPAILMQKMPVVINQQAIKSNLTYSNNNENTLVLYFDRSMGLIWNLVLYEDYLNNKENSFVVKHKEFTSYLNSVTTGSPTNFSNPYMQGSMWYGSHLLGSNLINPISNQPYNSYVQDSYFKDIIKRNLTTYQNDYNYSQIDINDLPYYGKSFNSITGEYWNLTNDLKEWKINGNATSATAILKYNNLFQRGDNYDSAAYLKFISKPNNKNLYYKNTDGNVFKYLYFQNTHGPYVIEERDDYLKVTNEEFTNYVKSIRYTINKLNDLFTNLKTVNHNLGGSVYDHTNIILVSDHGTNVIDAYKEQLTSFWRSEFGDNQILENKIKPFIKKYGFINTIFMYKPSISISSDLLPAKQESFKFNTIDLINNFDYPLIIESLMYKSKYQTNPISSYLKPDISSFTDTRYKEIDDYIVIDPLNNSSNINKRNLTIRQAAEWRWEYNAKYFKEAALNKINLDYSNAPNLINAKING